MIADEVRPFALRSHRPGDMGWVTHRHGLLYAQEYGWNEQFEALVAETAAGFIRNFKPGRERCWIAEMEGEIVGSVFLVENSDEVAQLRLFFVEPRARGQGVGSRLIDECLQFARDCGYREVVLWTTDVLVSARRLYESRGFRLTTEERIDTFGPMLTTQFWQLVF